MIVQIRDGKFKCSFGKLPDRLLKDRHVSIEVNCKVNQSDVLSSPLYGAETWAIYQSQEKKLHAYMMAPIRVIVNVPWKDKITEVEILCVTGLISMTDILLEKNLRWLGQVHRIDISRLPRQPLYFQLCLGMRNQERLGCSYKDLAKILKHKRRIIDKTVGRRVPTTNLHERNLSKLYRNLRTVLIASPAGMWNDDPYFFRFQINLISPKRQPECPFKKVLTTGE